MIRDIRKHHRESAGRAQILWQASLFVALAVWLAGCSGEAPLALLDKLQAGVHKVQDSSYRGAASSIDRYCLRVPQKLRTEIRRRINERTAEGDIAITCVSDQ